MDKSSILRLFLLLVFAKCTTQAGDDIQCPNNYTSTSTLLRLKKQIFCQYDKWIRPVKQKSDPVAVRIRLLVQRIDFNEKADILTVNSLFVVQWTDYHVIWNPSEFDNIDFVRIHSWYLWNPDLGILNSADRSGYLPVMNNPHCFVYSSGAVVCIPFVKQTASCSANLRQWPYDVHTCDMVIGSWMHSGEELALTTSKKAVEMKDFNHNREWDVLEAEAIYSVSIYADNLTYPYVIFKFTLRRHSGSYSASVVIPAGVLMLITLMSYWMDSCQTDRIVLATMDIFAHFIFLQYLGYILPSNGDNTPIVVTFYRDSLIITLLAFLTTIVIHGLRSSSRPVPLWAAGVSSWVLQTRIGQIIILHKLDPKVVAVSESSNSEAADLVTSNEHLPEFGWNTFTSLLNFIIFVITLLTYFILFVAYLP